jgi:hypothetical protein
MPEMTTQGRLISHAESVVLHLESIADTQANQKRKRIMSVMDRRQIARQIWEAHKHWDGEKKFALRMIIKWLEEEKNVGTAADTDVSGGS